jgi:hypothetical protein
LSAPKNTTSSAPALTPAALSTDANDAPAHRALPTALVRNGRPLLPEHSIVKVTSCRGGALI